MLSRDVGASLVMLLRERAVARHVAGLMAVKANAGRNARGRVHGVGLRAVAGEVTGLVAVEAGGEHRRLRRDGAITGEVTDLSTQAARHDSTERTHKRGGLLQSTHGGNGKERSVRRGMQAKEKQITLNENDHCVVNRC